MLYYKLLYNNNYFLSAANGRNSPNKDCGIEQEKDTMLSAPLLLFSLPHY